MAKVKVKTHSGAKKRFKLTKNGKVKYQHTNKRDTKRKRIARCSGVASEANAPTIKKLVPYK